VDVNQVGERVPLGTDNLTAEQAFVDIAGGDFRPTPQLVAALAGCLGTGGTGPSWFAAQPGAFGGALGAWTAPAAGVLAAP
jgi:hypothetical protein